MPWTREGQATVGKGSWPLPAPLAREVRVPCSPGFCLQGFLLIIFNPFD